MYLCRRDFFGAAVSTSWVFGFLFFFLGESSSILHPGTINSMVEKSESLKPGIAKVVVECTLIVSTPKLVSRAETGCGAVNPAFIHEGLCYGIHFL